VFVVFHFPFPLFFFFPPPPSPFTSNCRKEVEIEEVNGPLSKRFSHVTRPRLFSLFFFFLPFFFFSSPRFSTRPHMEERLRKVRGRFGRDFHRHTRKSPSPSPFFSPSPFPLTLHTFVTEVEVKGREQILGKSKRIRFADAFSLPSPFFPPPFPPFFFFLLIFPGNLSYFIIISWCCEEIMNRKKAALPLPPFFFFFFFFSPPLLFPTGRYGRTGNRQLSKGPPPLSFLFFPPPLFRVEDEVWRRGREGHSGSRALLFPLLKTVRGIVVNCGESGRVDDPRRRRVVPRLFPPPPPFSPLRK